MIKKNNKDVGFILKGTQNIDKIYHGTDLVFEQGFLREDEGTTPLTTSHEAIGKDLKDYVIYGNSVQRNIPEEYQEVEYIESTGTQYINLGVNWEPTGMNMGGTVMILSDDSYSVSPQVLEKNVFFGLTVQNSKTIPYLRFLCGEVVDNKTFSGVLNKKYDWNIRYDTNKLIASIDNVDMATITQYKSSTIPMYYFARNTNSTATLFQKARLYSLYYYIDDMPVFNMIPCYRKSDNVIGMYDTVTDTFYTNAGTGTFTAGPTAPTPDNPIEIQSVGDKTKNLFDKSKVSLDKRLYTTDTNLHTDALSSDYFTSEFIKVEPNTQYYYSEIGTTYTTRLIMANRNKGFIKNIDGNTDPIITTTADTEYVIFCGLKSDINNFMFAKSLYVVEYEPFGYRIPVTVSDGINSSTTNIYLKEPLRKMGDYADYIDFKNSKVVRNLGYLVFTRTTAYTTYDGALSATLEFNLSNSVHLSFILSNRAVSGGFIDDSNIGQARIYDGSFQVRVKYPDGITNANTKAEKKAAYDAWLSNHNIDLIYRLNTPTEETIELPDIPTFRGTTIFEVDTTVQPSNIKVIYKGK